MKKPPDITQFKKCRKSIAIRAVAEQRVLFGTLGYFLNGRAIKLRAR